MITHLMRDEVADRPVADVTLPGKTLQGSELVSDARLLLKREAIKSVPVLAGGRYVGVIDRSSLDGVEDGQPVGRLAVGSVPTVTVASTAGAALEMLDAHGSSRLVVLAEDNATYVGLICLRGDRRRLCIDTDRLGL